MEYIGAHIKRDRIYVNNRIVRHAKEAAKRFRKASPAGLRRFLSSMNSYMGIFKTRNGFRVAQQVLAAVGHG